MPHCNYVDVLQEPLLMNVLASRSLLYNIVFGLILFWILGPVVEITSLNDILSSLLFFLYFPWE